MIYLYIGKVQDDYFIMNSSKGYDFKVPSSNYGLICILDNRFEYLADIFFCNATDVVKIDTLILGCKRFKERELDYHLNKRFNDYSNSLNSFEVNTWEIQRLEAQNYLDTNGSYTSSILANIAQAKNIEVKILANSIIEKSRLHQARLLEFKLCKDRITTKLETLDTLEQLEAFDVVKKLNEQLGIALSPDEKLVASQEDLNLLPSAPAYESLELENLDSTDPINPIEHTENSKLTLELSLDDLKKAQITEYESLEQEVAEAIKTKNKKKQNRYIQASSKPNRQN